MRIGSMFSGAGGLDMAVREVFGGEVAWHSETDAAANKVLEYRWPGVPNLGDITAVDWDTVEPVDVICGGFPCTDISSAGRQAGMGTGTRSGLWSDMCAAIAALRPPLAVIENVRNLLSIEANRDTSGADSDMESDADAVGDIEFEPVLRGLGAVLGDLSDIGYDARWATVSASGVGAPHRRERVFIVAADAAGHGRDERRPEPARQLRGSNAAERGTGSINLLPTPRTTDANGAGVHGDGGADLRTEIALLATPQANLGEHRRDSGQDPNVRRAQGHAVSLADVACHHLLATPQTADGTGGHLNRSGDRKTEMLLPGQAHEMASGWGRYEAAIRRWETLTRPAPNPTEPNRNGNPRLNPAFSEWMMGWPAGWVTAVPGVTRNDQLKIIGNGVCPRQAAAALGRLLRAAGAAA